VVFHAHYTAEDTHRFVGALTRFGIGASWGGCESLALPTTGFVSRSAGTGEFGGPMVRFHVGLEDPADLIADLAAGFAAIGARAAP
jgi:cystathionine beta-lyase